MSQSASPHVPQGESLRSPLGRARGLGSAKEGVHHWWVQRLTAIALVPLCLWFVISVIRLGAIGGESGGTYQDFLVWLASPFNAAVMILFLGVAFHHAQAGVQVVLEDYVISNGLRLASIVLVKFLCYALAALSIVATLIVCFGV